jgi:hypothetical protein
MKMHIHHKDTEITEKKPRIGFLCDLCVSVVNSKSGFVCV